MDFPFPIPPGDQDCPIWTGSGFIVGSDHVSVLRYTSCDAGWNSELTDFHEKEADQGNHYMDRASRFHAINELKKYLKPDDVLLEIGSSSGYLLGDIKDNFSNAFIIGSDCIPEPLEKIATVNPNVPLIQMDLGNCPLPDRSVNVIVALNVLEHIEDDENALRQIHRILKPGGYAIIEVPANPDLYDFYDKQLHHYRRYSMKDLCKKVYRSGFCVQKQTYLGVFIYPAFRFVKNRNKQIRHLNSTQDSVKDMIQFGGPYLNAILCLLMKMELKIGDYIRYPKGIRCLVTLKKEI